MVMDYSEKRAARDGIERKPVQKNRPRKEPAGMFVLLSIAVLIVTFAAGMAAGWFLKGSRKPAVVAAAAPPAVRTVEPAAPAAPQTARPAPDAPLTFYKTLPAGGKAAMGSGLNPKKPEPPAAPHPAPVAAATPATPATPAAAAGPAATGAPAAEVKVQPAARYLVQIASYHDKKEADAAQAKLSAKGVAAYVVESKVADKGTWYRIRVGKHLSKAEADELAGKAGKGAMVLPE